MPSEADSVFRRHHYLTWRKQKAFRVLKHISCSKISKQIQLETVRLLHAIPISTAACQIQTVFLLENKERYNESSTFLR